MVDLSAVNQLVIGSSPIQGDSYLFGGMKEFQRVDIRASSPARELDPHEFSALNELMNEEGSGWKDCVFTLLAHSLLIL